MGLPYSQAGAPHEFAAPLGSFNKAVNSYDQTSNAFIGPQASRNSKLMTAECHINHYIDNYDSNMDAILYSLLMGIPNLQMQRVIEG